MKRAAAWLVGATLITASVPAAAATTKSPVAALADRWVRLMATYDPLSAEVAGIEHADTSRLPDMSPAALDARRADEDRIWEALQALSRDRLGNADDQTLYDVLHEAVLSARQQRVCRLELWNGVNHFGGWQAIFPSVARDQPVGTPPARAAALKRWGSVPAFVDVEIANLQRGLAAGYTAPKPVVERVLRQLDGLLGAAPGESPLVSPAARDSDPAFKQAFGTLIAATVNPAIRRYRDFLANEYRPRARDSLALSALPNGTACYSALLRRYTTLDRPPEAVFKLGQETVARYQAEVSGLGKRLFNTASFEETVRRTAETPENRFKSADELLSYTRDGMGRAEQRMRPLFEQWPAQPVIVEPVPEYQRGSGMTASYRPNPDPKRPAIFFLPLESWKVETRGNAELTVAHEAWPGHHLQVTTAGMAANASPLMRIVDNDAYGEGWGRYAERLAEEGGAYDTGFARITRRVWSARGMVLDPGIHLFGWTREQAKAYAMASGRFDEAAADALVDRVAAIPGQLTAYDSGGLEIVRLRTEAQAALGRCFDIRQFHARVLERGPVPLTALQQQVRHWIEATRKAPQARCSRLPQ